MALSSNVTTSKPNISGAVHSGSTSLTLPTDVAGTIPSGFADLGYVSEDGISNNLTREYDKIEAFGGDVVDISLTSSDNEYSLTLIEFLNADVQKAVYGSSNVTGSLSAGLAIKQNSSPSEAASWIFDIVLKNNTKMRICIPCAYITGIEEINYSDDSVVGYAITLTCIPDANGNTAYQYIKSASAS